jgi:signal transduction histidine kinase
MSVVLSMVVVLGASLRRFDVVGACLVASSGVLVAVVADVALVYGAWDTAACALLVWTVAGDGRAKAYAAGALLIVLTVVDVHRHTSGNEAFLLAVFGISAVAGHLWAEREREERAARESAAGLRSQRDAIAAAAVREERLRLARELHDVVSHAIGVMVLQAGAAEALRDSDPEAAREAVREVVIAGTGATSELEVLFGLVEAGAVGAAGVASPGADDVVALVRRLRAAGLSIDLDSDGVGLPPDAVIRSTVFRIVQEALTNAARHAPGAAIHVRLRPVDDRLLVEIDNEPSASRSRGEVPGREGFGLVGLAERVRALGGDLAAGPSPGGGFVVSARLPLTHEKAVS